METPHGGNIVVANISNWDLETPRGGNVVILRADIETEMPPVAMGQLLMGQLHNSEWCYKKVWYEWKHHV